MKKLKIVSLSLIFMIFYSCDKFFETTPDDFLSPVNYFNTEAHLDYALSGVYEILAHSNLYSTNYISEMGTEADEGYYRAASKVNGPQVYVFGPSDVTVTNLWRTLYEGINRANILLTNIDKPNMDEQRRAVIKGEALFLRSYFYFLLVINWGGVPLILEPTESAQGNNIPRASAVHVYEQIVADMKEAESLVPSAVSVGFGGRVSRSAVRGMLARVYLHWAGYPIKDESKYKDAKEWAEKVMDPLEGHMLNPSFEQVFLNYSQDLYDIKESILEVEFWGNLTDAFHAVGRVGNVNGVFTTNEDVIGHAYGFIRATPKLYNLYDDDDIRRDWAICPFTYDAQGNRVDRPILERNPGKYRREHEVVIPKHRLGTPINFPLLRYADVLLMYAEAENQLNGPTADAHAALNQVRDRAQVMLFEGTDEITDRVTFQQIIQEERARELCFEALRKYDLIRWGILTLEMKEVLSTLPAGAFYRMAFENVTDRNVLFPIPARELSLNRDLEQNAGW
ncbi:RagB/SusD family nutrient uptake outer membrane protein [Sphingobacterium arenae]|uniref:RagB/SusD family nutrient uptake outer membrane protein n=1 Tax=Sphingobacterium arenae TaxID=1280598 RepID=A0ABR7Y363_9SPHI|nr:RagB/SusD family nutrient uptake outer membrane protein [Sphingobacterium arenae]MBD1425742.1 RagB/SusD family nutrient uptake outer membrane protein [Sphingobacterium arenae]